MLKASYHPYILHFKTPGGTSRGVMKTKETYFIKIYDKVKVGYGECGLFKGLSADDLPDYEEKLEWTCQNIEKGLDFLLGELTKYPSIQFGLEQAFKSLAADHPMKLFSSEFTQGNAQIYINGLIWMGTEAFMHEQIENKLAAGFRCIKMKIGALDFEREIKLLMSIRKRFGDKELELRVDANGAFSPKEAHEKLKKLAELQIHSIEQPIKAGQWEAMEKLCQTSPIPIALDEELIGVFEKAQKMELLDRVNPQYIILKPSLIGGFRGSEEWIALANDRNISWWVTSALESNIGLNAIAQWTYTLHPSMPQGLGTGSLFTNNIDCPLAVEDAHLVYRKGVNWALNKLESICI